MFKHTPRYMVEIARRLRKRSTLAEQLLWRHLRNRKFAGLKFYRQFPIGRYIPDFYCDELNLVIELEGGIHQTLSQRLYDDIRFEEFEMQGFRVLRFKNEEVFNELEVVLSRILEVKNRALTPN